MRYYHPKEKDDAYVAFRRDRSRLARIIDETRGLSYSDIFMCEIVPQVIERTADLHISMRQMEHVTAALLHDLRDRRPELADEVKQLRANMAQYLLKFNKVPDSPRIRAWRNAEREYVNSFAQFVGWVVQQPQVIFPSEHRISELRNIDNVVLSFSEGVGVAGQAVSDDPMNLRYVRERLRVLGATEVDGPESQRKTDNSIIHFAFVDTPEKKSMDVGSLQGAFKHWIKPGTKSAFNGMLPALAERMPPASVQMLGKLAMAVTGAHLQRQKALGMLSAGRNLAESTPNTALIHAEYRSAWSALDKEISSFGEPYQNGLKSIGFERIPSINNSKEQFNAKMEDLRECMKNKGVFKAYQRKLEGNQMRRMEQREERSLINLIEQIEKIHDRFSTIERSRGLS
jgi:hypothetical protein